MFSSVCRAEFSLNAGRASNLNSTSNVAPRINTPFPRNATLHVLPDPFVEWRFAASRVGTTTQCASFRLLLPKSATRSLKSSSPSLPLFLRSANRKLWSPIGVASTTVTLTRRLSRRWRSSRAPARHSSRTCGAYKVDASLAAPWPRPRATCGSGRTSLGSVPASRCFKSCATKGAASGCQGWGSAIFCELGVCLRSALQR